MEFVLKRDNVTRRNSIYQMILRALKLKTWIELYCFKNKHTPQQTDSYLDEMLLDDDDWHVLTQLGRTMKIFEDATMASKVMQQMQNSARWESVFLLLSRFKAR